MGIAFPPNSSTQGQLCPPDPVRRLRERIEVIEGRVGRRDCPSPSIAFPSHETGAVLAGGAMHEWFPAAEEGGRWAPPLFVLAHLARLALKARGGESVVVWVGRRCWPYPPALVLGRDDAYVLLRRSMFVDPPDAGVRLWAIDLALRCPAVAAVVADGSGLDMAASRRLQLAARTGGGLGLLAKPAGESKSLSAAATRWVVGPAPGAEPRWSVELVRCKGVRATEGARMWIVEKDRAQGLVAIPADVGDRPGEAASAASGAARRSA